MKKRYFDIVSAISSIRESLDSCQDQILSKTDYELIVKTLSPFYDVKSVNVFLRDCKDSLEKPFNFYRSRDYAFEKKEPIVICFFKAPYNKEYGLDAFVYNVVEPEKYYKDKFPTSKATTIDILKCTKGFDQYPTCVALFPENFCTSQTFKTGFAVFYFVNVFERRFQEYGKPTLLRFINKSSFWRLKRLSKESRLNAFATWHYLHEHFHSTGSLPIADYLLVKSTKKTAAIEESRVDVLSILECLNSAENGFSDGLIYAELILFERLVRYAIHADPEENYDAKSSYILFGFLQNSGSLTIDKLSLNLNRIKIKESLEEYVNLISQIEEEIHSILEREPNNIKLAKNKLGSFADENALIGFLDKKDFFNKVKERLIEN